MTKFGIVIVDNPIHPLNAESLILVSVEVGVNVILDNKVQLRNALLPILVTKFGIVIDVNNVQP